MEKNGRSLPSSRNTFQRMLDLEKKNKLSQMQASAILDVSPARTRMPESKILSANHQATLQSLSQSMTVPDLFLSIPSDSNTPSNQHPAEQIPDELLVSVGVIARNNTVSDKSSICQSPGWDDTESRQRKKEKQEARDQRRREKEKTTMEAKKPRPQKRLTKAPPVNRAVPKLLTPIPRSESAPVVQALSGPPNAKDKPGIGGGKTSHDDEPRRFVPWKSANSTLAGEAQQWIFHEGFIGGVKLRQASEATVQGRFQNLTPLAVHAHKSESAEEFLLVGPDKETFPTNSRGSGQGLVRSSIPSTGSTSDQNAFSQRILSRPEAFHQASEEYVPSIQVHIRRGPEERVSIQQPVIQRAPVSESNITPGPDIIQDPVPAPQTEHCSSSRPSEPSKVPSSDRPPVSYREPRQLAEMEHPVRTRRNSLGFMQFRRHSSKDRSGNQYSNESRNSTASSTSSQLHSRGRSWSFTKSSKASSSRPTTADSIVPTNSRNNGAAPILSADSHDPVGMTGDPKQSLARSRNFSRPAPFQGLRSAAKAAFSKNSSSAKSLSAPLEKPTLATRNTAQPASTSLVPPDYPSLSVAQSHGQAERGEVPEIGINNLQYASSIRTNNNRSNCTPQLAGENYTPNEDTHPTPRDELGNGRCSNSSSLNDSSDEYHSIFDESSTSMPTSSRPQSEKLCIMEGDPSTEETINAASQGHGSISAASKDASHDGASRYEEQRGSTISMLKGQKNQSCRIRSSSRENSGAPNPQATSTSSKFSTSTDLQDLGFLPPLRHKTLVRPANGKGRDVSSADPPNCPALPTPSSSSSSPISPTASSGRPAQYLQTARQNLPQSSSSSRPSLHSNASQEANTLAKMFVICCHCHYYHDMPSKIYECMAKPDNVVTDRDLGVSGVISTAVKCPWCGHGMSTMCCEGWAAVVVLRERLH